jgi:hypothetical protein
MADFKDKFYHLDGRTVKQEWTAWFQLTGSVDVQVAACQLCCEGQHSLLAVAVVCIELTRRLAAPAAAAAAARA